jgi:hypothetical protein
VENDEDDHFALFDETLPVQIAKLRRDVPIDIANVIAEGVLDHLIEFHAATPKDRPLGTGSGRDGTTTAQAPHETLQRLSGFRVEQVIDGPAHRRVPLKEQRRSR